MAQPINPKIEELRFRLKTDPKSRLFYQLAEELRRAGQFSEAEGVLRSGLVSYPTYLAAWVSLGRVLREQKNDSAAVEALTTALQHDPGNVVAARLLADSYLALGEKVEAIKKYKLVQALLPTGDEELKAIVDQLDREISPPPAPPPPEQAAPAEAAPVEAVSDIDFGGDGRDTAPEPLASGVFGDDAGPAQPSVFSDAPVFAEPSAFTDAPAIDDAPALDEAPSFEDAPAAAPEAASSGGEERAPETAAAPASDEPAEQEAQAEPDEEAESPFDRTLPPFAEAERSLGEEMRVERETADVEPMAREHDVSPFEDAVAGSTAALEIEAPPGMQVVSAPLSADVASYIDEDLPTVDARPVFDTVSPAAAHESDDAANTITMADLYVRQGLLEEARHIYENILARDHGNAEVRAKLDAITPRVNAKVVVLERWLAKMSKREVGRGL
ncbi:MAG TPA: tetratricopeptide repeat protein [Thermoanaerobaculia bacterium]|jgi:tetratricopeptide (TPR) repeat protein